MDYPQSIAVRAGIGDLHAMIAIEGNGYSPDLAHDLANRVAELFHSTVQEAVGAGYFDTSTPELVWEMPDDDDDDDDEEVSTDGSRWWWLQ